MIDKAFIILSDKVYRLEISPTTRSRSSLYPDLVDFIIEAQNPLYTEDRWKTRIGMSWELSINYPGFNIPIPPEWLLLRFLCHHVRINSIHLLEGPNGEVLKTSDFPDYVGKNINNNQAEEILRIVLLSWVRTFPKEKIEFRDLFISTDLSLATLRQAINSLIFQDVIEESNKDYFKIKSGIFQGTHLRHKVGPQISNLAEWAGGENVTLAILFTDIVGSTRLGQKLGNELMWKLRQDNFEQTRQLISKYGGYEIKTIGDSFMLAFRNVADALDFSMELDSNPGHELIQIRVGIHIGQLQVRDEDVFGDTVDFASRVVNTIKGAEIRLSKRAKEDIDNLRANRHQHLKWKLHEDIEMKGFPDRHELWSVVLL